ncbi:MAG: glutathione S-transferase family protein [Proteobacteria bacterium]|nr:glutathione S-transferase family protein [Pseudomonadota bacterium]
MELFDWKNSYNSRKIRAVGFECDVNVKPVELDMTSGAHKAPDFLAMNPNGKVPLLKDGAFSLWESNAIMCYVASKSKGAKLLPTDAAERSKVDQWLFWQTSHLSPSLGKIGYEKIWKAKFGLGAEDPKAIEAAMPEVDRFLKVLDGELSKRDWVASNQLTVADFACAAAFISRKKMALDLTPYKSLTKWLDRVESRPSWKNAAW